LQLIIYNLIILYNNVSDICMDILLSFSLNEMDVRY